MRLIDALIHFDYFAASTTVVDFPVPDISKQKAHVGLSSGPNSSFKCASMYTLRI